MVRLEEGQAGERRKKMIKSVTEMGREMEEKERWRRRRDKGGASGGVGQSHRDDGRSRNEERGRSVPMQKTNE